MKVILKEYVYKHGVAGDVVTVTNGFARNFLIPQGKAIKATPGALRENQQLIAQAVKHRQELKSLEDETAQKIHGVELVFGMKAGKNNKLYGSVTTMDIAQALQEKTGVDINRRRISERSLRELGIHDVPVRISSVVSPMLKVVIIREEEVESYLAGKPVRSLSDLYDDVIDDSSDIEAGEGLDEDAGTMMEADDSAFDGEDLVEVRAENPVEEDETEGVE